MVSTVLAKVEVGKSSFLKSIWQFYVRMGLQKRRNNHTLFQLYKFLNGLTPQYLQSLIPQRVQNISRYQLRNVNNFNVPPARTVTHANSFLQSTLRDWNSLDLIVRNSPTLKSFKLQLNQTRNETPYSKKLWHSSYVKIWPNIPLKIKIRM